jgi:hypothetical protein
VVVREMERLKGDVQDERSGFSSDLGEDGFA